MLPSLRGKLLCFCFHLLRPYWEHLILVYTEDLVHSRTLLDGGMLWLWAALPQVIRSQCRQNDVFISSRVRQDGERMREEQKAGQTRGERVWKEQRNAYSGGRDNDKEWKWMINDEKERRGQRREGSLPVNQIMYQSFDRELLWPETWRITFSPTHIHTFTDALSIIFTQLHGDKCVSLASSLVLSARIRAYQHSCMCSVCVYVCVWV